MAATYEILVPGNSLKWSGGFLGFANLTLVTSDGTLLFDTGHYINRGALVAALAARNMAPGDNCSARIHGPFHVSGLSPRFPGSTKPWISG